VRQSSGRIKILVSVILVLIIIVSLTMYMESQRPQTNRISVIANPSLVGISENPDNTTYEFNFSEPSYINPSNLQVDVISGSYHWSLNYNSYTMPYNGIFNYINKSGLPYQANIANLNGSSAGIFSGAIITIFSFNPISLPFTKYGSTVEIICYNRTTAIASLPPVSLSGTLKFLGSYNSTDETGRRMTVASIYMSISPSPLQDAVVTVDGLGVVNILEATEYTTYPAWPSNSSEIIFTVVSNNTPELFYAFSQAVGNPMNGEIWSGNVLYIATPNFGINFNGVEVTISSLLYVGSIEVTL